MNLLTEKQNPSLIFCIIMDLVGYATFVIPVFGELADIIWAPISALVFYKTFGGKKGAFGAIFNFAEEILPFTDFLPTFSIMWVWQFINRRIGIKQPKSGDKVYLAK